MIRRALPVLIAATALAQSPQAVEITAEPHHHLVLENNQLRVFYVDIPPQESTLEHWHRHDYIYISIGPAQIVNTLKGKDAAPGKLADGETGLASGNFEHTVRNVSSQPFRNVDVELLQDEKLRAAAATGKVHWDEDRGLDILHGGAGTREILWIKDGIRATEFELQPGANVPAASVASSPHSHPLLLIAVNDFDLYLQDPRTHAPHTNTPHTNAPHTNAAHEPMPAAKHFTSGSAIWLAAGFSRPLTNASHSQAKFITLEFP